MLDDIREQRDPSAHLNRKPGDDGRLKGLVELYLQREVRGLKRSGAEIERTFNVNIIPVLGDRYADSITKADVTKLVEGVTYTSGDIPVPVSVTQMATYPSSLSMKIA